MCRRGTLIEEEEAKINKAMQDGNTTIVIAKSTGQDQEIRVKPGFIEWTICQKVKCAKNRQFLSVLWGLLRDNLGKLHCRAVYHYFMQLVPPMCSKD